MRHLDVHGFAALGTQLNSHLESRQLNPCHACLHAGQAGLLMADVQIEGAHKQPCAMPVGYFRTGVIDYQRPEYGLTGFDAP